MQSLLKIILVAFLAYVVYSFLRFYQRLTGAARRPPRTRQSSGIMVKDEVCNTYLPKEDAVREVIEGKEHYFCSQECRKKYLVERKEARRERSES